MKILWYIMPWMGGSILSTPFVYCFLVFFILLRTAVSSLWFMCFVQCVSRVSSGAADQAFMGFMYIILFLYISIYIILKNTYLYVFTNVEILPRRKQGRGVIHRHTHKNKHITR